MASLEPQQVQQPPPPQQVQLVQPVVVYPNPTFTNKPPSSPTSTSHQSHSNGSFGTVFIVLAVIAVVSAIACLLSRLCNRGVSNGPKHGHKSKSQSSQNSRPKDQTRVHELAGARDHHDGRAQLPPQGHIELGKSNVRSNEDKGVRFEFGNNSSVRKNDGDHVEFGFDSVARPHSSGGPVSGRPVFKDERVRSGRGHVAFEVKGGHATAKIPGGNGDHRHDYHGGPRASD